MKIKQLALAIVASATFAALAQGFPNKPIKAIVPFAAGSATDQIGRAFASKMSEALGQPIVVENKAGVNGMLGADAVAKSAPDGYTILLATSGTHVTAVHLTKNLSYDPVKDFEPIIAAVEPVTSLVVHPSVPADTVPELIAWLLTSTTQSRYNLRSKKEPEIACLLSSPIR